MESAGPSAAASDPSSSATSGHLRDRDEGILAFNQRVLGMASQARVPLLERLRFLCIVSANLDEFFEVRMALHLRARELGQQRGPFTVASYARISAAAKLLIAEQYRIYNEELLPDLGRAALTLLASSERSKAQQEWVGDYFRREVQPLLLPIILDPAHPFPQVATKSLNFIVQLGGNTQDQPSAPQQIAIVRVPRSLPRMILLPRKMSGKRSAFVSLSSVIRAHLQDLFPHTRVERFSQFRLTRDSELLVDEDDVLDLRKALRERLETRPYGQPVRLEVSSGCPDSLAGYLLEQFGLPTEALYKVNGPVNLVRLQQVIDLISAPELLYPPYLPSYPVAAKKHPDTFKLLKKQDVLLHQPYESFEFLVDFMRQAVADPAVVAIKLTIYRTGSASVLMELLQEAVARGIDVTVVVELKARFDEENNIRWAERLESVGVQVVYGVVGFKTHAKMLLITRREDGHLQGYAHLSTGNYNEVTATRYTDVSHFTSNAVMVKDVEKLFRYLASPLRPPSLQRLLLAPFSLQQTLLEMIESATRAAQSGVGGVIIAKMNALTDLRLADALADAAAKGVEIDLIVRGSCVLQPSSPAQTNLRIRSVIGRFLEHSRLYYFRQGRKETLLLSSADWMNRNMTRRIEIAWPVVDPDLRERLVEECLTGSLSNNADAWSLMPGAGYERIVDGKRKRGLSAQEKLMRHYGRRV